MAETTPISFKLTPKQVAFNRLLGSDARHVLAFGGGRSGKTFLIMRAIVTRALGAAGSRHVVLRFRFNHLKPSIIFDTLPKMMDLCFPGVAGLCHLDKQDWFYKFPNGSEIWFGGLDDKERTEKILGQEYSTIFFNECSQIPWASRVMAMTRLAQKCGLRLKAFYDCNPPSEGHWTYKLFVQKRSPDEPAKFIGDPDNYVAMQINPSDNADNLPKETIEEYKNLTGRAYRRFWLGEFGSATEGALWSTELLDQCRFDSGELPEMQKILIAVDPSGCSGPEDKRSDEVGIVVVGLGDDGKGYVLEDLSGRFGPSAWGKVVVSAFDRHAADAVVAETNFGGAMVSEVIRSAAGDPDRTDRTSVPVREVTASRGKVVRAEPVSTLFEQKKVFMVGRLAALEDQLCGMTMAGYTGGKSPDRADAMIWGLSSLFPALTRKEKSVDPVARPAFANVAYAYAKRRRR